MRKFKITAAVAAAFALNGLAANTWWVDAGKYGASGDGTSAETAFGTIQEAIDNPSFAAGDTVKVLPGVYDKGETYAQGVTNRVVISKACTIVSTGGAAVTHIVGKHSTANSNGTGPDAIRCVAVTAGSVVVRLEGFTLRGGAAAGGASDSNENHGAAFLGTGQTYHTIVDCVVSNCVAYKGVAARNASAARTLVLDNVTTKYDGSMFNGANLLFCIVKNNKGGLACSTCNARNCTIFGNERGITGNGNYYNVHLYGNSTQMVGTNPVLINCCQTGGLNVAPALGDYRPIAGSELDGGGDPSCLSSASFVTAGERYLDFNKHSVPSTGACDIGAVQGAVAVVGGALQAGAEGLMVDGVAVPAGSVINATAYPTQWLVKAVEKTGKWFYGFKRTATDTDRFHPDLNGDAFVMPPPTGVTTVTTVYAEQAYWVNPNKDGNGDDIGSDDNPGTEEAPFHTLQKAMDVTANSGAFTVVFASEGYYDEGGACIHDVQLNSSFITNRVCSQSNGNRVRMIGAGPGKSFIVGAPDPDTGGNGPKAVRPLGIFCNFFTLQGFTLTNGYSAASSASNDYDKYGAAYGRQLQGIYVQVLDCEITQCHGRYGVANHIYFSRCRFHDNFSDLGRSLVQCTASSCLLENDAGASACRETGFYHSTVFSADPQLAFSSNYNTYVASVVCGGLESRADDAAYGSIFWNVGDLSHGSGDWKSACPYFVDSTAGDWRIRACSEAVSCAAVRDAAVWSDKYWKLATIGLDGNRIVVTAGSPLAGCCQEICADPGLYISAAAGGVSVAGGWHSLDNDTTLTVAAGAGTRPCIGYVFGGETNLFETTPTRVFTIADCPNGAALEAIYTTHWYVDATKPDDTGLACWPGAAKKTFAGLFGTGNVIAGDTVHAAEGVYDSGVMHRTETDPDSGDPLYAVGARLIVPSYVTVVADGSRTNTVIKGASSTSNHQYGLGPDAVRCVTLYRNARIRGFTLEDGRTDCTKAPGSEAYKEFQDNTGSLVQGATKSSDDAKVSVAEDCILRNGVANRGAAAYAHLVRCRVYNCRGVDTAGAVGCTLRCHHTGTLAYGSLSDYCVMYPFSFVYSTVRHGNGSGGFYNPSGNNLIRSSVIACGGSTKSTAKFENTIFQSLFSNATEAMLDEGSQVVGAENLQFDDDCRPVIGANAAVDAGNASVYESVRALVGETDLTGMQRVMNGRIDAGALEADWRDVYAHRMSWGSIPRIAVTEVSPEVVDDEGGVRVPEGASMTFRQARSGKAVFSVNAAGGGTVTVKEDGVEVMPGPDGRYAIFGSGEGHVVSVACAGDPGAYAVVSGLCSGRGFSINIR